MKIHQPVRFHVHYPVNVPFGHEDLFYQKILALLAYIDDIEGAVIAEDPKLADFHITLLEHYPDTFVQQIVELSQSGVRLWCFVPRGMVASKLITDEVLARSDTQWISLYDDIEEIHRMIRRMLDNENVTLTSIG